MSPLDRAVDSLVMIALDARALADQAIESGTATDCLRAQAVLRASLGVLQAFGIKGPPVVNGHVYLIECTRTGAVKVGWSTDPESRRSQLQASTPYALKILATFPGRRADERAVHALLEDACLHGEWFAPEARARALAIFRGRGGR